MEFGRRLRDLAAAMAPGERQIVALAGPPGSGKSTLAERLASEVHGSLGEDKIPIDVLPMDGFHYDDELLKQLGRHERKGAPDTFDVGGLEAMIARVAANEEDAIVVPRFDRDLEIARAGARFISRYVQIVIVEGNYLLLDDPPWSSLGPHFDISAMIEVGEDELAERLTARWDDYDLPPEEVRRKVEENDLPNARFVMTRSRQPDVLIVG
ncbi:MAG: nucleoside/nucleotide kinase family protein [Pseudomonadota bacterium]